MAMADNISEQNRNMSPLSINPLNNTSSVVVNNLHAALQPLSNQSSTIISPNNLSNNLSNSSKLLNQNINNKNTISNQQQSSNNTTTTTNTTSTNHFPLPTPLSNPSLNHPMSNPITHSNIPLSTTTNPNPTSNNTPLSSTIQQHSKSESNIDINDNNNKNNTNNNNTIPSNNSDDDENLKKDLDHIVPNAKTTTTTQSNGSITTKQNMTTPTCKNCKTQTTPLWRRDETGQVLCNACGLFLKLHGRPRPISLKSDVIKSRNRVKHNNKSSPNTPELKAKDSNGIPNSSIHSLNNGNFNNNTNNANNANLNLNNKISTKFLPKQYKPSSNTINGSPTSNNINNINNNNTPSTKGKGKKYSKLDSKDSNKLQQSLNSINSKIPKQKLDSNSTLSINNLTSPSLLPLLPRSGQQNPIVNNYSTNNSWLNKSQVHGHIQGPNIQSLHYPSSTPTHFVSDLNRITSPLLLATTTPPKLNATPTQSQSSERSSSKNGNGNLNRDAVLNAAGALEILSQTASNKISNNVNSTTNTGSNPTSNSNSNSNSNPNSNCKNNNDFIPGMRLNSPNVTPLSKPMFNNDNKLLPINLRQQNESVETKVKSEPIHLHNILTPNNESENNNTINTDQNNESRQSTETSLPPIKSFTSPLLSGQINNQQQVQQQVQQQIQQQENHYVTSNQHSISSLQQNTLPSLKNLPGISNVIYNSESNNNNSNNNIQEENERLRTRNNELELVNELYKTRIAELEQLDKKKSLIIEEYEERFKNINNTNDISNLNLNNSNSEKRNAPNDDSMNKRVKVEN